MNKIIGSQKEVIFRVDNEEYGISISEVVSIEKAQEITAVAKQNPYLLGVTNLRGTVIPIFDLRKALGHPPQEVTDSTRYIMVLVNNHVYGFVVDSATDVLDVPASTIQRPAVFTNGFIYGIAKLEEQMIILLDIPQLMKNIIGDISL